MSKGPFYTSPLKVFPVHCLTVQATSFCNLDCKYCYLPNRQEKGRFDTALIPDIFRNLADSGLLGDRLYWNWHAGEPLVAGYPFYREATEAIHRYLPAGPELILGLQTNATLVDDNLAGLFRDYRYRIGVSIDGPAFLHDGNRVYRNGKGSFAATLKGMEVLRKAGVPFHVICVLTGRSLHHPEELYHFFRSLEVTGVAFNIEEIEGIHTTSSLTAQGAGRQFDRFFDTFFALHLSHGEPFAIREWDRFSQARDGVPVNGTTVPFDHLTIGMNGDFATFSPELATLPPHERYGSFVLGNIRTDRVADAVYHPRLRKMWQDIRKGVRSCRQSCAYYSVCGGGMMSNKLHEHGTFAATDTLYCRLMVQQLSEAVNKALI